MIHPRYHQRVAWVYSGVYSWASISGGACRDGNRVEGWEGGLEGLRIDQMTLGFVRWKNKGGRQWYLSTRLRSPSTLHALR